MALLPGFLVAAALLAVAGAGKLAAPDGGPARVLGAGEVCLGAAAALSPSTLTAGLLALTYAGFGSVLARRVALAGGPVDCGCFGARRTEAGLIHVALNVGACVLCSLAVVAPPPGPAWLLSRPPVEALALVAGVAAATYAAYMAFALAGPALRSYRAAVEP